jgi:hypothetical protein
MISTQLGLCRIKNKNQNFILLQNLYVVIKDR